MTFSIVISTYNRNADLINCLNSLSAQTYKQFETVVVNGGEIEPVKRIVGDFSGLSIKLVEQERRGLVEARNLGWRNSRGEIVCFIDDDLVVSGVWLDEIRKAFSLSADVGGVSGPTIIPLERRNYRDFARLLEVFNHSGNIFLRVIGSIYKNIVLENRIYDVGKILPSGAFTPGSNYEECLRLSEALEVDYLEACHMCFRKDLLSKIGGFDYAYTGTAEWNEPDFSFKVRKLGARLLFNPKAVTWHCISQGGVFKARTNAYERSRNFIHFYCQNIKPNSLNKIFHFAINLCFINGYWVCKFVETGDPDWLRGVTGTLTGLLREV